MPCLRWIGIDAGHHGAEPLVEDGLGQDGGGGGAVAGDVAGLGGHFADHAGAHVLVDVFQVDFLGHGHAVLGDGGRAEALLQDDVASAGSQRDLHRLGQLRYAAPQRVAGFLIKRNHFRHEIRFSFKSLGARPLAADSVCWMCSGCGWTLTSGRALADDRQNVFFAHQQQVAVAELELLAGIGGEQHAVAGLDLQGGPLAVLSRPALADADHLAAGGLVLGGVGQDDAAGRTASDSSRSTTTRSPSGWS